MSANINQVFGRASFFSAREKAWHGLGTVTEGALSSAEAIKAAHLDYEVGLMPIFGQLPARLSNNEARVENTVIKTLGKDGIYCYNRSVLLPKSFATYRMDTEVPFGIVGSKYTVVQNWEGFEFFDAIVGKGEAIYETAGALGDGETVFITAKLPDYIRVPGEAIEKYLMLKMTHDGKGSIVAGFTPVRVVCSNTLHMALQSIVNKITIRHTASAQDKLKEAHKVMGMANKASEQVAEIFAQLKKETIVDKDAMDFFKKLIFSKEEYEEKLDVSTQKKNVVNDMYRFYNIGIGQQGIVGTKFGVYNAVSGYYQNVKTSTNTKQMLESNMFGYNAGIVEKSLKLLMTE